MRVHDGQKIGKIVSEAKGLGEIGEMGQAVGAGR
jgi:hypothetical protein